jgi:predicted Rdx family selenoprotein
MRRVMTKYCKDCKWLEVMSWQVEEGQDNFSCAYPISMLPLSMAGYANRERETVKLLSENCPVWTKV